MKCLSFIVGIFLFISLSLKAQETDGLDLLSDLESESVATDKNLLPEKMLFTQRALWGEKGLYRKIGIAPKVLTPASREKELKARRTMFRFHQILGALAAGGMLAQGIVGSKLYAGDFEIRETHRRIGNATNIIYGTTALLSFGAPPPLINRKKFDNIKLHKILSAVHFSGMIATNILGRNVSKNIKLKPYHRAIAYGTFGSYAIAIATIKFEF